MPNWNVNTPEPRDPQRDAAMRAHALRCAWDERDIAMINEVFPDTAQPESTNAHETARTD